MRSLLATTMMLLMMTAALAGCAGSDVTQDDVDTSYDEGYAMGVSDTTPVSTMDTIVDRGSMKCGVKESQYGMGYLDATSGVRSGLDIAYCRAVAAAIGLNPDTGVEYIPASGSDRFDKLSSGTIDVLIRTTTWTTSRDADLNADFAGMNFFDGQGILVRGDAFPADLAGNSASGLNNANICVGVGTTTEGNMQDWFSSRGIQFTSIGTADAAEATDKLISGECDAFTGDMSAMVAKKWALDNEGTVLDADGNAVEVWIASELLSKEPLGAATRDGDSDFKDVVAWVWYGMITAEEMGVTAANAVDMAASSCALTPAVEAVEDDPATTDVDESAPAQAGGAITDPGMCRLLTSDLGLGTTDNPVAGTWMQAVLAASGNYGEAYDDAFCDGSYDGHSGSDAMTGCLISRAGTANALVSEGGLQFAPPMR